MKKAFLWWWLSICITVVAICIAAAFEGFQFLWDSDQTKISLVTLALFAANTGWIGYVFASLTKPECKNATELRNTLHLCWFSADTMVALGLIGTVVGFMLMLGPAFDGINVADHQVAQKAISNMAAGMSTAFITTFIGLSCGQHVKKQLVLLEHGIKSL